MISRLSQIIVCCLIMLSVPARSRSYEVIHVFFSRSTTIRSIAVYVPANHGTARAALIYSLPAGPSYGPLPKILSVKSRSGVVYAQIGDDVIRIARGHAQLFLPNVAGPAFSPDGAGVAFTHADQVWTRGTGTFSRDTLLDHNGFDPCWSFDSKRIAYVISSVGESFEGTAKVIDAKTKRVIFSTSGTNPNSPLLSPTGAYLAVNFHLSRPVTGDFIFDTRTGRTVVDGDTGESIEGYTPANYLPGLVSDWSPDGKWMLWDWRVPDPNNDGMWLGDDVGLTSADGKWQRKIGIGRDAHFVHGDKCILFLTPEFGGKSKCDLMMYDRKFGGTFCVERNVDSYFAY